MSSQGLENAPLRPVLRLIHCIQKERGASCVSLVGSLSKTTDGGSLDEHPYESNLRSARIASNSAISSFYRSYIWRNFRGGQNGNCNNGTEDDDTEIATMLFRARQVVDGGAGHDDNENPYFFFHVVIMEYNLLLTRLIQAFVVNDVSRRMKDIRVKINASTMPSEARRNATVALSLMDLILSFVTLKENLGMERATLSGLMTGVNSNDNTEVQNSNDQTQKNDGINDRARLNLIVNDLVMVVENQHRIMRDLKKKTGLDIRGSLKSPDSSFQGSTPEAELSFDKKYWSFLRLVEESISQSEEMLALQHQIRSDFDIHAFQQAMTMEEFWNGITLYMDTLHSMELFLLEELDNCQGGFEDLDLLSLGKDRHSLSPLSLANSAISLYGTSQQNAIETINKMNQEELKDALLSLLTQKDGVPKKTDSLEIENIENIPQAPSIVSKDLERPVLEEWEISLYEVEFHKRIGRGSAGTTYLGKYSNQNVAVKVAATHELGLGGWAAELKSLKAMHHTNIIRFLGAIYNPSPLTYCLVLEYCDGGDLSVALDGVTPPKFFTTVTSGIASGLNYLHKKDYMHRDIKPSNVLISGDLKSGQYTAKLTDFGLAVKVQHASVNNGKKELTAETGTYRYMAPEVIRHEAYNFAADIYSFALLMWEMITREQPFEPQSQIEAAGSVALEGKRPPFPNGIPLKVKTLIENCWAKNPDERLGIDSLIKRLGELDNDSTAQSWLAAPLGHSVYKTVTQGKPQFDVPTAVTGGKVPQKKKSSLFRSLVKKKK